MGMYGSPDLTPHQPTTNVTYCKKCGAMINKNVKKCPYCHHRNKSVIGNILAFIGATIVVFFIIMSVLVFLSNPPQNNTLTINSTPQITEPVINREEFIESCKEYTYKELARNPNKYLNEHIKLKCKVFGITQSGKNVIVLANVDNGKIYSSDTIYIDYTYSQNEPKILDDDTIIVYGIYKGDYTYTTVLGALNTVPRVDMKFVDIIE